MSTKVGGCAESTAMPPRRFQHYTEQFAWIFNTNLDFVDPVINQIKLGDAIGRELSKR
jgi:hypothetical protein